MSIKKRRLIEEIIRYRNLLSIPQTDMSNFDGLDLVMELRLRELDYHKMLEKAGAKWMNLKKRDRTGRYDKDRKGW